MFSVAPNDDLSQNAMKLGHLVALENVDKQRDTHSRFMFYKYKII